MMLVGIADGDEADETSIDGVRDAADGDQAT